MHATDTPSRPDWELLVSWVAVVETGSVSDAARLLQVSQATVSQRIKQLESLFETSLLDRSTRPAQPTAAGQRLFENAKELIAHADQLMENVRNVSRAKRMVVRLGCIDSVAATVGPLLIRGLAGSSHQIRLWSGITSQLDQLIERRELDLLLTTGLYPLAGVSRIPLFAESFYVVLPREFEFARSGTLTELGRRLKLIRYSARSLIGQQVEQYLQRNGDMLERTYEFDATDTLLSLVASGMGFALTTPLCVWQSRQFLPDIQLLPLGAFSRQGRPYPDFGRSFNLSHRPGELGSLPSEIRDLIKIAVNRLRPEISRKLGLTKGVLQLLDSTGDAD